MIPYKYTYLIGTLIFFIPWTLIYYFRKDLRKEILMLSKITAIASFITAILFWTIDWWRPQTVTGTAVGIEDLLLGFSNGGICAAVYEVFAKKRYHLRTDLHSKRKGWFVALFASFSVLFLFYVLQLHSFIASALGMILTVIFIIIMRKDLIVDSLFSGFLMVIISTPVYLILEFISPGWIQHTWFFYKLTGIMFLGIPVEDLIFYFLLGAMVGPFYELHMGYKLVKSKKLGS